MTDKVSICNIALQKIGAAPIISLTDNTNRAQGLNTLYDETLLSELSKNFWNFSIKRASLPADATAPDWGFGARYLLPGDFLTFIDTEDDGPYSIEDGFFLTDDGAPLKIRYVFNNPAESSFHKQFAAALACKLALDMTEDLTQKGTLKQDIKDDYRDAIKKAMAVDAIQQFNRELPETEWLLARV